VRAQSAPLVLSRVKVIIQNPFMMGSRFTTESSSTKRVLYHHAQRPILIASANLITLAKKTPVYIQRLEIETCLITKIQVLECSELNISEHPVIKVFKTNLKLNLSNRPYVFKLCILLSIFHIALEYREIR